MRSLASQPTPRHAARLQPRRWRTGRVFVGVLALCAVALGVLVVLLARENQRLRAEVQRLSRDHHAPPLALRAGDLVATLRTYTHGSDEHPLVLEHVRPATLLFIHDSTCPACEAMLPGVARLSSELAPRGVLVVGVQVDATTPADLKHATSGLDIRGVPDIESTWVRSVGVAPALVLIDATGTVREVWLGEVADAAWTEIRETVTRCANGG